MTADVSKLVRDAFNELTRLKDQQANILTAVEITEDLESVVAASKIVLSSTILQSAVYSLFELFGAIERIDHQLLYDGNETNRKRKLNSSRRHYFEKVKRDLAVYNGVLSLAIHTESHREQCLLNENSTSMDAHLALSTLQQLFGWQKDCLSDFNAKQFKHIRLLLRNVQLYERAVEEKSIVMNEMRHATRFYHCTIEEVASTCKQLTLSLREHVPMSDLQAAMNICGADQFVTYDMSRSYGEGPDRIQQKQLMYKWAAQGMMVGLNKVRVEMTEKLGEVEKQFTHLVSKLKVDDLKLDSNDEYEDGLSLLNDFKKFVEELFHSSIEDMLRAAETTVRTDCVDASTPMVLSTSEHNISQAQRLLTTFGHSATPETAVAESTSNALAEERVTVVIDNDPEAEEEALEDDVEHDGLYDSSDDEWDELLNLLDPYEGH